MTEQALTVADVRAGYGALRVLHDVSMSIAPGEFLGLTGSNGAGKTTLVNTICGLVRPSAGVVTFEGADITRAATHRRIASGIAVVPEGRRVFGMLSVEANLNVTVLSRGRMRLDAEHRRRIDEVFAMFPILGERRQQPAGQLSGGQQQMLAIGRALMLQPRLLVLDEPTQGLAPALVDEVAETLRGLRGTVTALVVEQNSRFLEAVTDRLIIMRLGRLDRPAPAQTRAESHVSLDR